MEEEDNNEFDNGFVVDAVIIPLFMCGGVTDLAVETSRDSYIGRNPLPKLRTHKPTRTTRVLQTVVA